MKWHKKISNVYIPFLSFVPIKNGEIVKDKFTLNQKYRKPFGSKTIISFVLSRKTLAKLTLYDETEREVTILINKKLKAGTYEYELPISNIELLSKKIHYSLEAYGYYEIKEMKFMKDHYLSEKSLLEKYITPFDSFVQQVSPIF